MMKARWPWDFYYMHMVKMALYLTMIQNYKNIIKTFLDPDVDSESCQNVTICSMSHNQHFLKFSLKSIHSFR